MKRLFSPSRCVSIHFRRQTFDTKAQVSTLGTLSRVYSAVASRATLRPLSFNGINLLSGWAFQVNIWIYATNQPGFCMGYQVVIAHQCHQRVLHSWDWLDIDLPSACPGYRMYNRFIAGSPQVKTPFWWLLSNYNTAQIVSWSDFLKHSL